MYDLAGQGDALVFQNGNAIKATWKKANPEKVKLYKKNNILKSDYGLSLEEVHRVEDFQEYK